MIRNLVENARRHGGGASIEVTLSLLANGLALVEVSDRGPGVPEESADRIFEPFYRLPTATETGFVAAGAASGAGTGLGLSLARQVARRHGGDIVFLPREGGGSVFRATVRA
jgi:signal transduction histidine kinase